MNYQMERLADISTMRTGKLNSNAAVAGGAYPFFTCAQETYWIDKPAFNTEAVILGGNNANGVYPLKYYNGEFNAYQRTYIFETLDAEKLNIRYLYYALRPALSQFQAASIGAATQYLTKSLLDNFKIPLPDIDQQNNIVSTLSNYDDLIENNKRRIELLEESARQLYKEWFVRFRFPGHEHVKIIDNVPDGWEKKSISALCSFLGRGMTPSYDDEGKYIVINQKCIRNRLLSIDLARRQSKDFSDEKLVQKGDVLINSTGTGTLGRVAQCWIHLENYTVDTHVTIARPKADVPAFWFGYCLLELETIFEGMGEGATNQKELKRDLVGALQVLVPPKIMRQEFDDFVCSLIGQISNLMDQNRSLISARDILLPKLMSGEIAV